MCGIKIPQQYFALKIQGGLMREGRRICGTLRYKQTDYMVHVGQPTMLFISLHIFLVPNFMSRVQQTHNS